MDKLVNEFIRNGLLFLTETAQFIGIKYFILMLIFGFILMFIPSKTTKAIGGYLVAFPLVFSILYLLFFVAVFFTFGPEG